MRWHAIILVCASVLAQTPPPAPSKIRLTVGSETASVRALELAAGSYVSLSPNCGAGSCTITVNASSSAVPGVIDFSGANHTIVAKVGVTPPATCTPGEWFFDSDEPAGANLKLCTAVNTWQPLAANSLPSYTVATLPPAGTAGRVAVVTDASVAGSCTTGGGTALSLCRDSGSAWLSLGGGSATWGGISGVLSNQTDLQAALDGKAAASHTHALSALQQSGATTGQVPQWNGTAWTPASLATGVSSVFGRSGAVTAQAGDYAAAQVANTPAGNIAATNVQAAINELDAEKAAAAHTHGLADLSQSGASAGQVPKWNGTAWVPAADEGGGAANYSQSFTAQTSVTLAHNASTTAVVVACYDAASVEIVPQSVAVTNANTVTVGFGQATTGYCVVNTSGGGGGGGGVTSVGLSMPDGFTVTGSPITSSGTLAVTTSLSGVVKASGGAFSVVSGNASDCVRVDGSSGACGGGGTVYTGAGLTGDGSAGNPVRVDPAGAVASQTAYAAPLDFGPIAAGSCSELNIAANGVSAGMTVAPGWPTLAAGLVGMMYAGNNVVVVRVCNVTGAAIDPASASFSARVIGGW